MISQKTSFKDGNGEQVQNNMYSSEVLTEE